ARARHLRGRAAVGAVRLGGLQAPPGETGAVRFDPMPAALRAAAARLEVSQVCKVVLRFREPFWEAPDFFRGRLARESGLDPARIDFLHDPDGDFPTWWLANPWRVPVVTAWAGGARADALAALDGRALAERALDG